ncbi:MAG: phage shock protein operon transcriptional activator [Desulfomicrobium apsheronum]|nr:phage shock protein operon transcriptional activator [Desulfomicrobium apsheronum]
MEAIGQSEAFLQFQEQLSRVARIERPVLIIGERGTGKELAAARLHYLSRRWQGPLVTVNCAALAGSLLDTELFGHEVGAFTGATVRRKGRFENADTGTLVLDEIANLSPEAQEKILRVVEYGSFDRVGGSRPVTVNVRIVGATNVDLPHRARAGAFKEDLLDRLSFEVLTVPPLRMREGDVQLLTRHFAARMAIGMGLSEAPEFSARAMSMLLAHDWPGNVRELKNVVERAVYRTESGTVRDVVFDPFASPYRPAEQAVPVAGVAPVPDVRSRSAQPDLDVPLATAVRDLEEAYLTAALEQGRHNQKRAAALLGLTYHQFRGLYRRLRADLDG